MCKSLSRQISCQNVYVCGEIEISSLNYMTYDLTLPRHRIVAFIFAALFELLFYHKIYPIIYTNFKYQN